MNLILIAGMPASGKSTIAAKLSRAFGYPILEKDAIKEELFDTIGFRCYAEKRRHDVAATAVLLRCSAALMEAGTSHIIVNNFREDMADTVKTLLDRYGCNTVTVFFGGDADVFYRRYVERDLRHARHLGHALQEHYPPLPGDNLDYSMTREEFAEKFEKLGMDRFSVGGTRIELDATDPSAIEVDDLIRQIQVGFCKEK